MRTEALPFQSRSGPGPSWVAKAHTHAVAVYEGIARQAVHELKYTEHRDIATVMGPLMAGALPARDPILIPVPLHPSRRRERGYNQAELLAQQVRRSSGASVVANRLRRVRPTASQVALDHNARRANVKNAFAWYGPPIIGTVVLVDDVATTMATLDSCAEALHGAGMHDVQCLVFALTVG